MNSTSKIIALFDFDGTLTSKDSLGDFIQFAVGKTKTFVGLIILSPILLMYALGIYNNSKAKQQVLKYFFCGFTQLEFKQIAEKYSIHQIPKILKSTGINRMEWHQKQGHKVVIVSASAEDWLKPWTEKMGIELISTKLEVKGGKLTGCFKGENCHGEEKVIRIKSKYNLSEFDLIYGYGDTAGDIPMLKLADYSYYKEFTD